VHAYLDFRLDFGDPDTVAAYDELTLWSALAGQLLLHHVPLGRHLRVLDAGCGTGFPLLELAERLGSTSTVHGVDTWGEALDRARFKARVRRIENVELVRRDVASLPFPDSHFDLIVSNLGINNFAQPERAVRECRRVIKPGGRLAFATNLKGHMKEFYEAFEATLAEAGDAEALEALEEHIGHRAGPETLAALLAGAGFRLSRTAVPSCGTTSSSSAFWTAGRASSARTEEKRSSRAWKRSSTPWPGTGMCSNSRSLWPTWRPPPGPRPHPSGAARTRPRTPLRRREGARRA
jgi:ubiquinone/menaquinone biosynthesis C-methylase UbiE